MKHSDFQSLFDKISTLAYQELMRAVKAHGGVYEWNIGADNNFPIIAINPDTTEPEPQDVIINKVAIVDGELIVYGVDKKLGGPVDFEFRDIFIEHISVIIDEIPETNEISDVSIPQSIMS